jgi:hypothetical protein
MHKDTAKLLLGLVPVASLIGVAVAIAPRFDTIRAAGVANWAQQHPSVVSGVVAVVIGVFGLVVACCYVLLAAPKPWRELRSDDNWLSDAFSSHAVGIPYFSDSSTFLDAEANVAQAAAATAAQPAAATAAQPAALPAATATADVTSGDREAVAKAVERTLLLSERLEAASRFKKFAWLYVLCLLAIVGGAGVVLISLPAAETPITIPTTVQLHLPPGAEAAFDAATGCVASRTTVAVAVGGFWDDPELRLYGLGCHSARWSPQRSVDVVITAK